MKAFLMYRDQDLLDVKLPPNSDVLIKDLELKTLFDSMAQGDEFLFQVVEKAILSSLNNPDAIKYRQQILSDCLEHMDTVREIYSLAVEAIQGEKDVRGSFRYESPDLIVNRAVEVLETFVGILKRLRNIAQDQAGQFRSEGFVRFFTMLKQELGDDYFRVVENHLHQLRFQNGVLISAELGKGNKGTRYALREPIKDQRSRLKRIFSKGKSSYSFRIEGDSWTKYEALDELSNRGINLVANALVKATYHILSFFTMLQTELGFYVGCLNLYKQLELKGEPTCIPTPSPTDQLKISARGLYDVCLTLKTEKRVVGNDLTADNKKLLIITGANQGGKSTFLRSVGLAHLMMQCGMFVAAEYFSANICTGLFTHYKRKEDTTMESGKLDEELGRMSEIADHITPGCILLCNESFSSTNEREGSEIARQIISALLDLNIKVLIVTHLFELAQGYYNQKTDATLFLRAERQADGQRTYRIIEGEPLPTSHGKDLYTQIFETTDQAVTRPTQETRPR